MVSDLFWPFVLRLVGKGGRTTEYAFLQYRERIEFINYVEELLICSRQQCGTDVDVDHR